MNQVCFEIFVNFLSDKRPYVRKINAVLIPRSRTAVFRFDHLKWRRNVLVHVMFCASSVVFSDNKAHLAGMFNASCNENV